MDIKEHINKLLDEYGWSKYKLAKESGLSSSTIKNMFSRNNDPSFATLEAICRGMNITLSEFFAEEESESEQHKFMSRYNSLTEKQRQIINDLIDSWK